MLITVASCTYFVSSGVIGDRPVPVPHYVENGQKKDSEFWKDILEED